MHQVLSSTDVLRSAKEAFSIPNLSDEEAEAVLQIHIASLPPQNNYGGAAGIYREVIAKEIRRLYNGIHSGASETVSESDSSKTTETPTTNKRRQKRQTQKPVRRSRQKKTP